MPIRSLLEHQNRQMPVDSAGVLSEKELPKGKTLLCFLPHCDDVRFIGSTLKALELKNTVQIIVMASGHHAIPGRMAKAGKIKRRKAELMEWAEAMAFKPDTIHFMDAEKTYDRKVIIQKDQLRVDDILQSRQPDFIMLPHIDDVLQPINRCTRRMVMHSLKQWLEACLKAGQPFHPLMLWEYPTLYNPFISFKYRNLNIIFQNRDLTEEKHLANQVFRSPGHQYLDVAERCMEAYDAACLAEFISHYQDRCRITPVYTTLTHRSLRCEHFYASRICFEDNDASQILYQEAMGFSGDEMDFALG